MDFLGCDVALTTTHSLTHFPTVFLRLDKVVTPLLGTPYETQLAKKVATMRQALQEAAYLIKKTDSNPVIHFSVCYDDNEQWN